MSIESSIPVTGDDILFW